MKWIRIAGAVVATLGLTTAAQAGLFGLFGSHGSSKSCGCAPCSQPACCKPTIKKPCCPTVHTYQRKISDKKPPCCDTCCAPKGCCPKRGCCMKKGCCHKQACAPKCAAPCPQKCAAPCPQKCAAPCPHKCAAPCPPKCAAPVAKHCCPQAKGCCPQKGCCEKQRCCNADPCVIAKLIYKSQTACYAKDRRKAIDTLGDDYDCVCNPEIMVAFIYALNDADEDVRKEAADEIGDQLRKNPCCCSKEVTAALTAALGDCDRGVVRQAVEALEACGYEVVDGCCDGVCCDPCKKGHCGGCTPGAPMKSKAPMVPGDQKVYAPAGRKVKTASSRLANLFGFLD